MPKKGTTSIVGYIAMLMIAGASLGHGGTGYGNSDFQTNALAFRNSGEIRREIPEGRRFRVQIDGRTYDAVIVGEADQEIRLSF